MGGIKMNAILEKALGASWGTSLIGYGVAALTEVDLYLKTGSTAPQTPHEWMQAIVGIMIAIFGRISRQSNVSSEQEGIKLQETKP
jgi:hypothetical protein